MKKLLALGWDFDGTIADSSLKNYNVTLKIVASVQSTKVDEISALSNFDNYLSSMKKTSNWRTFYRDEFNLTEQQIDAAGKLWTDYQLKNQTKIDPLYGVLELISSLKEYPQVIISQNSKQNILNFLAQENIEENFYKIIGYEEVDIKKQKPNPEGFLLALEYLNSKEGGTVIYIGDHEADVEFAVNTAKIIGSKLKNVNILSVAFAHPKETFSWKFKPEFASNNYYEIQKFLQNRFDYQ